MRPGRLSLPLLLLCLGSWLSSALVEAQEPVRLVIECEDMLGVSQTRFGPGKGWQVGRWGQDLYQNMIFGGVWASRLGTAMTEAADTPSEAYSDLQVPTTGTYKVWVKYECPPFFNYAFGLRLTSLDTTGAPVFDRTYGLLNSPKHFCFTNELTRGSLYWAWGTDHDAAEGYTVDLKQGRYRVTLYKAPNPAPAAARSVDAILITSDLSDLSSPRYPRYPLLDELRRANHVYFRFRSPRRNAQPVRIVWNHWNHRYPDFYAPSYRELVKFYDGKGNLLDGGKNGDWPVAVPPGQATAWYDLGPTMNTESSTPFMFKALPSESKETTVDGPTPSVPFSVDLSLKPDVGKIVKSLDLGKGEAELDLLVQPDLHRAEGLAFTQKMGEVYQNITRSLNGEPRLGPIPKKLRLYAATGGPRCPSRLTWDFEIAQQFRHALGLNTIEGNTFDKGYIDAVVSWRKDRGGLVERTLAYHHSQDPAAVVTMLKKAGVADSFHYLSYGDEIGLPPIDDKDPGLVNAFHDYLRSENETPESLGARSWEQVKPLPSLSADVAVKIGVLPEGIPREESQTALLKRLYWYSHRFRIRQGIQDFARKTEELQAALGKEAYTSANLGSMHPFYWMHQSSFIDAFKHKAMSLAWSEDYTYCQPEASRLVVDFEASYLRKGASYHDTPMMFYCMPHYPGNTPEHLLQNAVLLWANNVKDLDFFIASPDAWSTENYVTYRGGLPTFKAIRRLSGMAGLIENDLIPARPDPTPVAMLLSEASDVWELEGLTQWDVKPGSVASNVSQEERKDLWYALRLAGYRVDVVTEEDVVDGLLNQYKAVYLCGRNLRRQCTQVLDRWVENGGLLFATAGAATRNEFDEPMVALDKALGRGVLRTEQRYRGALRAKLELLFEKPLDSVKMDGSAFDVLCSKESFDPVPGAEVLARFVSDGAPAMTRNRYGKGVAYYIGALPGQAFVRKGLPLVPMGKGGNENNASHFEPVDFDPAARDAILRPLRENDLLPDVEIYHRSVVAGRLSGPSGVVVPVVNLAEQADGRLKDLRVVLKGVSFRPAKAWSCFFPKGIPIRQEGETLVLTLPRLQTADVIVINRGP
ncbi:MAG: beta-galactosidase trimerization domain-containing protein [Armatimonadetes bacterium]|nr:beta-galactosidase trimerization domain-containing protein [Armatimonadota bacterium]